MPGRIDLVIWHARPAMVGTAASPDALARGAAAQPCADLMWTDSTGDRDHPNGIWPATKSMIAGPAPRYGTCTTSTLQAAQDFG